MTQMVPIQFRFTSYALVGLAILILSTGIVVYLVRLQQKNDASRLLLLFFCATTLSGIAIMLTNSLLFWNRMIAPWQDFWILAGGVALTQFAYCNPQYERSREATGVLVVAAALAGIALLYILNLNITYLTAWTPELEASDLYYLLLPLGVLLVIAVFVRRAHLLRRAYADPPVGDALNAAPANPMLLQRARMYRGLAIGLTLAFLPAIQTLVSIPSLIGFVLSNVGALLAVSAVGLVYFSMAPEVNSFMAKLVGVMLAIIVLILTLAGSLATLEQSEQHSQARTAAIATLYDALHRGVEVLSPPAIVAYIVAWEEALPDGNATLPRDVYRSPQLPSATQARALARQTDGSAWQPAGVLATEGEPNLWWIPRYVTYPAGSGDFEYRGYGFQARDTFYEVGLSYAVERLETHQLVVWWMALLTGGSLLVVGVLPIVLRQTLVRPLAALMSDVERVGGGDLGIQTPIQYYDEIGQLTLSFNVLSQRLKEAQEKRRQLVVELRHSAETLEQRVAERTGELSAFTDMTMLASEHESLETVMLAALARIVAADVCEATTMHLFEPDQRTLTLLGYVQQTGDLIRPKDTVLLDSEITAALHTFDTTALVCTLPTHPLVPPALRQSDDLTYIGCAVAVGSTVLGWLSCYRRNNAPPSVSESSLFVALARQIGIIVENDRLRQRIRSAAIDEERQRLAQDLHDSVTQLLYSTLLFNRAAKEALEDDEADRIGTALAQTERLALRALGEMRALLFELQPPVLEQAGLVAALEMRLNSVERRLKLAATFETNLASQLHHVWENDIYLIVIEALNNVIRHAGAAHVTVSILRNQTSLTVRVQDDGRGFDTGRTDFGYGMRNMELRAARLGGTLDVTSRPGHGTTVCATIPNGSEDKTRERPNQTVNSR